MDLTPIKGSSVLAAQGYDPATGTLRVQLRSGKIYEYSDVSVDRYAAFTGAMSPGTYWNSRIKANHVGREIAPPPKPKAGP